MEKFSERLYTLDVGDVPMEKIPRIVDPTEEGSEDGVIICFHPTRSQLIQLALIVWQVATRERNSLQVRTREFEIAEQRCTKTRNIFKSLLLPFVDGDSDKARDLCVKILRDNKPTLDKYIGNWSIIKRPSSVWVDKDTNGIFICKNEGRVLVGLNPTNYVFIYEKK